jgi:adenylate kinase family enzyme
MMLRVSVVGTTCSGKTRLSRKITSQCDIPHIELDAIHWQANWTPPSIEQFRLAVERVVAGDEWVIDGNYSSVRDIVWGCATDVVWLDLPLMTVFWRAILRTGRRVITGEELWADNRETVANSLLSRDGIPWYVLRTHHRRRREYGELLHRESDLGFFVHEICDSSQEKALLDCLQIRAGSSR